MKKTAIKFILVNVLILLSVSPIFAESNVRVEINGNEENSKSTVDIKTNTGNNTICQNGKCTTTSNEDNGKSTVCINGKCTTTEGDVNMKSENGNAEVNTKTNTANSQNVKVTEKKEVLGKSTTAKEDEKAEDESKKDEEKNNKKEVTTPQKFNLLKFFEDRVPFFKFLHDNFPKNWFSS